MHELGLQPPEHRSLLRSGHKSVLDLHVGLQGDQYATAQGVLNWVGQWAPGREPERFEARLYDVLFRSEEPADADDWLADLNPGNLEVVTDALATPGLAQARAGDRCDGYCRSLSQSSLLKTGAPGLPWVAKVRQLDHQIAARGPSGSLLATLLAQACPLSDIARDPAHSPQVSA